MSPTARLDCLALAHGTDKSSRVHGYTRIYEKLFASWQAQPIRLLEIGVGTGCSLRMWRDYFSCALIFGLDVCAGPVPDVPGATLFQGDQSDAVLLHRIGTVAGPFHVIIDDGSHRWSDQIFALERLYPFLAPGGYYAIEDLHTSWWSDYQGGAARTIAFLSGLVHELNLHGQSGYGDVQNDPEYPTLAGRMTGYQATLESLTFFKSLAVLQKKTEVRSVAERPEKPVAEAKTAGLRSTM